MVGRAVDNFFECMASNHIRVVNKDTPEINEDEEHEVQHPVQGEKEDEEVIRDRLEVSVNEVERV